MTEGEEAKAKAKAKIRLSLTGERDTEEGDNDDGNVNKVLDPFQYNFITQAVPRFHYKDPEGLARIRNEVNANCVLETKITRIN